MAQEIASAIPEPEQNLQDKEKASGLGEMAYLDFCYAIKRFTFNGNVLNDEVFQRICPELGLNWEDVINEGDMTPQFLNWRNKHLHSDGTWDVETMLSLGFLLCAHPSRQDQREEFWQLVNPELNDGVHIDRVLAFLTIFVQLSLDMRYTIEVLSGDCDQQVCDYIKLVDQDTPREDVAAHLLGFPSAEQLKSEFTGDLNKEELFDLVQFENCMSTLGIRLRLLDSSEQTHHSLIEEGL